MINGQWSMQEKRTMISMIASGMIGMIGMIKTKITGCQDR
jgi:hypothetical protein